MLDQLFKPAWQSASVEKRLKAVVEMDAAIAENKIILFELAKADGDTSVRLAAIDRLQDVIQLSELLQMAAEESIKNAAGHRIDALISSEDGLLRVDIADLLQHFLDVRPRIATHAALTKIRMMALELLTDSQKIQVLGDTHFTDSRQFIAEQMDDIGDLESARKVLRGKDKKAERIVKSKIDAYRNHQRRQADNKALIEKLIEEVEYLAAHEWLPEFKARCAIHRQHWAGIDFEVDTGDLSRYQIARDKVEALLEQQRVIEETRNCQQLRLEDLQKRLDDMTGLELASFHEALADFELELRQCRSDWVAWAKVAEPEDAIDSRYQKLTGALQASIKLVSQVWQIESGAEQIEEPVDQSIQQLDKVLKKFVWSIELNELRVVSDLNEKILNWRNKQKLAAHEYQQKLDRINNNIRRIFHLSRTGNLPSATQMAQRVEKSLTQIEGKEASVLQEKYGDALKALEEMGDWKNYATEPKYLELCESMERLIDADNPEEKRYEQMKALQTQWKSLGYSDISEQYWPRFKEAADKVYQLCAEHFKQRRQTQKNNLDNRQQFVEQMRELLENTAWDSDTDYKAVQSSFYAISGHFSGIKDVDHRAGQKQWKQFSSLKNQLKAQLDVAYDSNIEIKKRLIVQAQQLAESDAVLENQDKLKTLQGRWSQVGITRRKQDQKAWGEFKDHCDTAYNRLQSLRRSVREENDQQLDSFRRIIQEIQKLAKKAGGLAEADHQFRDLQEEYHQLPELPSQIPQKLIEGIRRDFTKACGQYEKRQQQVAGNQQLQQMQALRKKALLCEQLEACGESPAGIDLDAISEQWQTLVLDDPALSKRIETRRDSAASSLDRASISLQRRMLCIQLEIALGEDSPVEDRDLRMQYQLQRMNQSGLGQQQDYGKKWFKDIELDWLCMPGAEPALQRILNQRFQRVIRKV